MSHSRTILPGITVPYATNLARNWVRSGAFFGVAGFMGLAFFCDWKDVLINVPIINDRYKKKD